jgi:Spy/CpxP family protein refolding chaperone
MNPMGIKVRVVAMVCGLALGWGYAGAARAQQGGGSAPTRPVGAAAGSAPAGGAASGSAQSAGGAGAMSADTPEDDAALNLTDEQKAQIKTIREDGKQQIAAMEKDPSLSEEAKQQKLKVIRKDIRRQVWSVMTPEQQKQWAAEQRELREHKHGGGAAAEGKPQN